MEAPWKLMISTEKPECEIIFSRGHTHTKSAWSLPISTNSPAPLVILWSGIWDKDFWTSFGLFPTKFVLCWSLPTLKIGHWGCHIQCLTKKKKQKNNREGDGVCSPGLCGVGMGGDQAPSLGMCTHWREHQVHSWWEFLNLIETQADCRLRFSHPQSGNGTVVRMSPCLQKFNVEAYW